MALDFALLGINAEAAERAANACPKGLAQGEDSDFELWPEHEDAWNVFTDCGRQWRVIAGLGFMQVQGLDATAVESSLRMQGVARRRWRLVRSQVRILEDEAVGIMNSKGNNG